LGCKDNGFAVIRYPLSGFAGIRHLIGLVCPVLKFFGAVLELAGGGVLEPEVLDADDLVEAELQAVVQKEVFGTGVCEDVLDDAFGALLGCAFAGVAFLDSFNGAVGDGDGLAAGGEVE
jgi:hypothetical protein